MFEWEYEHRTRNLADHGVDFVRAARMFDNPVLEREDVGKFHGEKRYICIGHWEDFFMVVVWTPRAKRRKIIAAWRADRDDQAIYRATVPFAGRSNGRLQHRGPFLPGKQGPGLLARGRAALSLPKPPAGATTPRS